LCHAHSFSIFTAGGNFITLKNNSLKSHFTF
jgi:hypothetical protein